MDAETYRLLVEQASDGVAILQDETIKYVNPMVEQILGYDSEDICGKTFSNYLHPDDLPQLMERYRRRMAGEDVPARYETRIRNGAGAYVPVEINAGVFPFDGSPADVIFLRDITARRKNEDALRGAKEKIEQLHGAAYRLADCESEDSVYEETIRAAEEILEFGKCSLDIVEGDRLVVKATSDGLEPGESQDAPLDGGGLAAETLRTGKTFVFGSVDDVPVAQPTHSSLQSGISLPIGCYGVVQVASTKPDAFTANDARLLELLVRHTAEALERLCLHQKLETQATHDPLTGVYNRRHLTNHIGQELERSKRYEHPLAFLMMDINGFKDVNDMHGHQTGDDVLCAIARAIQDELRAVDMVVRYGGDEFLAVLPETNGEADEIARRMEDTIASRGRAGDFCGLPITIAVGMAYWLPSGDDALEDILRLADKRMYAAKAAFRQRSQDASDSKPS